MWPFSSKKESSVTPTILLSNTRSGKKEPFAPMKPGAVLMYSCGPTVYSRQHIGNLRAAVFSDTLARVLMSNGYKVRRVTNITDVGHLTGDNEGDADAGEDRMEKSARESGIAAAEIADRYTQQYLDDIRELHVDTNQILFPKATTYVPEQIDLVKRLEELGHTYRTPDGIYFDTTSFPGYGALGGVARASGTETLQGRIQQAIYKKNPADFALWRFSPAGHKRQQEWPSPWGRGFPGWHLECSAMIKALLGAEIDIHTGGIEHIAVHHNNEIAQSEPVSRKPLARYWLHNAHLTLSGEKLAKSAGNALYLSDLHARGIHSLALRYLFLQAHYRTSQSFTWESVTAANEALQKLWKISREIKTASKGLAVTSAAQEEFAQILRDDLATPRALAYLWERLKAEDLSAKATWALIEDAERVFGLSLTNPPAIRPVSVPEQVLTMVREREEARAARDFARADGLRIHIENSGYAVDDGPTGPVVTRK